MTKPTRLGSACWICWGVSGVAGGGSSFFFPASMLILMGSLMRRFSMLSSAVLLPRSVPCSLAVVLM